MIVRDCSWFVVCNLLTIQQSCLSASMSKGVTFSNSLPSQSLSPLVEETRNMPSQSERGTRATAPSSSGIWQPVEHDAPMKFLSTMKKVQSMKRIEKMMRAAQSGRSVPAGVGSGIGAGELTPLRQLDPSFKDEDVSDAAGETSSESIKDHLFDVFFGKGIISACLLVAPIALWSVYAGWSPTAVFWLNFIVMVPLAAILGDFTEELALHTNETIGGLINATFGNAVEVVVGIQALLANEIRVVQSSMLGSIFSNLLLVLGGCFFFGGLKYHEQSFNATAASANMGLLALSGIALVLPTPFAEYYDMHDEHVLLISRISAIFLMFMYVQLLIFQLKTHADVFDGSGGETELAVLPFWMAIVGLLVTTLLVMFFSEFLVSSIDGFVKDSGISRTFVGIIILPIVGNAVEHVTAITVAMKNKMDLAMGVAIGSCTQISLFVVPLMVLIGWATDRDMSLNFPPFEVILFVMSIFTVSVVLSTPKCNWLEGSLLMTTYFLLALGFWFESVATYSR